MANDNDKANKKQSKSPKSSKSKKVVIISGASIIVLVLIIGVYLVFRVVNSPEKIIAKTYENISNAKSYHVDFKNVIDTQGSEFKISISIDYVDPDKMKSKFTPPNYFKFLSKDSNKLKNNELSITSIIVKDSIYTNILGEEFWTKTKLSGEGVMEMPHPKSFLVVLKAVKTANYVGIEQVRGKSCNRYSFQDDKKKLESLLKKDEYGNKEFMNIFAGLDVTKNDIWIGVDDNLPYKQYVVQKEKIDEVTVFKGDRVEPLETIIYYSDFNKDFKINASNNIKTIDESMKEYQKDILTTKD